MFFVSLFSVKLSRQHNKCDGSTHADTRGGENPHRDDVRARAGARVCVCVIGETDLILCSRIGGNGGEEEEPFTHKDVFPSANYRDRL